VNKLLVAPDIQRSYSISADWIELLALARAEGFATDGDILQPNDILEDRAAPLPEGTAGFIQEDPDILDQGVEPALDLIFDELAFREKVLGPAYPFTLEGGGRSLKLMVLPETEDATLNQGRLVYIACLFMSAARVGLINTKAGGIKTDPVIGNLFQICATIAAAGYVGGDAYWFGHPRPDETPMIEAVKVLSTYLHTSAKGQAPEGETRFAKDGGIDVVAWRDHLDARPAKLILYGQCASGMNWEGKPVGPKVSRMNAYYINAPSAHWLPALLSPFPLYMDKEYAHDLKTEDARAGFYRQTEAEMGVIIDRLRIVHWCIVGLKDPHPSMSNAINKLDDLFKWSADTHSAVREAA
jgi:hypothetical protein